MNIRYMWGKTGVGDIMVMVFNATFNKISFILWLTVLLVKEIGVPGQNQLPNHKSQANCIT